MESFTANEYEFYLQYRAQAPLGLFSLNQNPKVKGMQARMNQARLLGMFSMFSMFIILEKQLFTICEL